MSHREVTREAATGSPWPSDLYRSDREASEGVRVLGACVVAVPASPTD